MLKEPAGLKNIPEDERDILLEGDTYHIKEELKTKFNARWLGDLKKWTVKKKVYAAAQKFVDTNKKYSTRSYTCVKCGDVTDNGRQCDKCEWGF